jgi:hypothetical protein
MEEHVLKLKIKLLKPRSNIFSCGVIRFSVVPLNITLLKLSFKLEKIHIKHLNIFG